MTLLLAREPLVFFPELEFDGHLLQGSYCTWSSLMKELYTTKRLESVFAGKGLPYIRLLKGRKTEVNPSFKQSQSTFTCETDYRTVIYYLNCIPRAILSSSDGIRGILGDM